MGNKLMHGGNLNASADNGAETSNFPFGPHHSSTGFTTLTLISIFCLFCLIAFCICRCVQQRLTSSPSDGEEEYPYHRRSPTRPPQIQAPPNTATSSNAGSLPTVPYGEDERRHVDCVICLSEFQVGVAVKVIPFCRHVFHPNCLDTWLVSHGTCSVCRSTRIFEEVQLTVTVTGDEPESSAARDCEPRDEGEVGSGHNNAR